MEATFTSGDDVADSSSPLHGPSASDDVSAYGGSSASGESDSSGKFDCYEDFNGAAFERLRWSVFDPAGIAGIRVLDSVESEVPTYTSFTDSHDLMSQYVTKTFAKKIIFFIEALGEYESEWNDAFSFVDPHPEPMRLEDCWDAMVVQREDNEPLTIGDVVRQLQAHFDRPFIRNRTREALAWMYNSGKADSKLSVPEDVNIFLEYVRPGGIEKDEGFHRMSIELWVEGEDGVDAEQHWGYGTS